MQYIDKTTPIYYDLWTILSKEHKVITPIISKNACSSLVLISLKRNDLEKEYAFKSLGNFWSDNKRNFIINPKEYKDFKKVAVIRHPVDRIISAYTTIGRNKRFYDYCDDVIDTLKNVEPKYINRHFTSQFLFYDYKDIDLFIPIEKLNDYLKQINIQKLEVNKSNVVRFINEETKNKLLEVLKEDYKIYTDILKSDKCFK